jgi:hypothetical protein
LFYKKYGFQLDVLPISFNETLYKKKFCFARSNGIKPDFTANSYYEFISKILIPAKQAVLDLKQADLDTITDLAAKNVLLEELIASTKEITQLAQSVADFHNRTRDYELKFRQFIFQKMKEFSPSVPKERLPVIFCKFQNRINDKDLDVIMAETFHLKLDVALGSILLMLQVYTAKPLADMYKGPLIIIDINAIKRSSEWMLAHEIVHAARHTTADNQGSKDNIMIYADATRLVRTPSKLNLEPTDKIKLEAANFVV